MKFENREIFQQVDGRAIANIESFCKNVDQYLKSKDKEIYILLQLLYRDIILDYKADVEEFGEEKVKNHKYYVQFRNALKKLGNNTIKGIKTIDSDNSKFTQQELENLKKLAEALSSNKMNDSIWSVLKKKLLKIGK